MSAIHDLLKSPVIINQLKGGEFPVINCELHTFTCRFVTIQLKHPNTRNIDVSCFGNVDYILCSRMWNKCELCPIAVYADHCRNSIRFSQHSYNNNIVIIHSLICGHDNPLNLQLSLYLQDTLTCMLTLRWQPVLYMCKMYCWSQHT